MIITPTLQNTPDKNYLMGVPDGKAGTLATLKIMRRIVKDAKTRNNIRNLALSLISNLPGKDWIGEIKALHYFVRDQIRYVKDVNGIETLHTPEKLLEKRQGDCDDKCILLATLLESIGHPARFVAVSFGSPNDFSHVYVETMIGKKWIPLESTEKWDIGIAPPRITNRLVVHI